MKLPAKLSTECVTRSITEEPSYILTSLIAVSVKQIQTCASCLLSVETTPTGVLCYGDVKYLAPVSTVVCCFLFAVNQ
jgi:hypothetical protein